MVTPSKGKFGNILQNYLSNWKFYSYLPKNKGVPALH